MPISAASINSINMPHSVKRLEKLAAPAKLNLFLHVTGRRPDGMHLLESVFILVDLADELDIECLENGAIVRTGDVVGDVEKDLCVRAAAALKQYAKTNLGAAIHVAKKIPSGAGMGGGSSDCAATLLALNRLWGLNLSRQELMQIAAGLGADVPFFIFGQNAFASGIGEKLTQVNVPPSSWLVVMPATPTSTAAVFSDKCLTRDTKSLKMAFFSDSLLSCWPHFFGRNDLEAVARRINPDVDRALEFLSSLGCEARMTGSGSAVFAHMPSFELAQTMLAKTPADMTGYAVRTLSEHPLKDL